MKRRLDYSKTAPDGIAAWSEPPVYTEREKAALAWTESVPRISEDRVPHDSYHQVKQHFIEKEVVDLTLAAIVINSWTTLRSVSLHQQAPTSLIIRSPRRIRSEKGKLIERGFLTVHTPFVAEPVPLSDWIWRSGRCAARII